MSTKRGSAARSPDESNPNTDNRVRTQVLGLIQQFAGQDNTISTPRAFVTATGNLNRAVVLNQIVFWHGVQKKNGRSDGWFFKNYAEWEEETGLGEFKVRAASDWLEREKVIERKLQKAHGAPTLHYRLSEANFPDWILEKLKNRSLRNSRIPDSAQTQDSLTDHSSDLTNRSSPLTPKGGTGNTVVNFPLKTKNKEPKPINDPHYKELMDYLVERGGRDTKKQRTALTNLLSRHSPNLAQKCFEHFFTLPTRQYAVTWATVDEQIDQWVIRQGGYEDISAEAYAEVKRQLGITDNDQPAATIAARLLSGECAAEQYGFLKPEFLAAWDCFARWRADNGNPLTPESASRIAAKLAGFTEEEAIKTLRYLLVNHWQSDVKTSDGTVRACIGCDGEISNGQKYAHRNRATVTDDRRSCDITQEQAHLLCLDRVPRDGA